MMISKEKVQEFLSSSTDEQIAILNSTEVPFHIAKETLQGQEREDMRKIVRDIMCKDISSIYKSNFQWECDYVKHRYHLRDAFSMYNVRTDKLMDAIAYHEKLGWMTPEDRVDCVANAIQSHFPRNGIDEEWAFSQDVDMEKVVDKVYSWYSMMPSEKSIRFLSHLLKNDRKDLITKAVNYKSKSGRLDYLHFDFCIQHSIDLETDMRSFNATIKNLDRDRCKSLIDIYKAKGAYEPNSETYSILIIRDNEFVPDEFIDETVLDSVLFNGSLDLIKDLLQKGFVFKDKVYLLYVPCPECYNGEMHRCNDRYVSTNFIITMRCDYSLEEIDKAEDIFPFWCAYGHFDGPADDSELYIKPGVNESDDWNDEADQRIYEIPPVRVDREPGPVTKAANPIPEIFIPIHELASWEEGN